MENLSAEVGHKMRSAVKAKLIEMGTGGSAGYIDDELPDYVMIMVANKRSKQQMTDDLTLFLGDNTPQFVDWLYLVLQKLQEVAIPAAAVAASSSAASAATSGKSGKSKQSATGSGSNSKDAKRADKKSSSSSAASSSARKPDSKSSASSRRDADDDDRGNTPPPPPAVSSSAAAATAQPSITDVFAEHLIQKARSTVAAEKAAAKSLKAEDAFDIPTMSEIVPAGPQTRRKELAALADLQKKINQAKRQLSGQAAKHDLDEGGDDGNDDDDDDFININDEELGADVDDVNGKTGGHDSHDAAAKRRAPRVPITFREEPAAVAASASGRERSSNNRPTTTTSDFYASPKPGRSSVLDRLGVRQPGESSNSHASALTSAGSTGVQQLASRVHDTAAAANHHARRGEQEIYVPSFRRKDAHNERNSDRDRNPERSSNRDRDRDRDHRDRDPRGGVAESSSSSSSRRDRERERERDLLRSRNPDREAVSGSGQRDRQPDRSRERQQVQPQVQPRLKDRLGAAVNSVPQLSAAATNVGGRPDLRDRMRARSANRSRGRSSDKSSASAAAATTMKGAKQTRAIESKVLIAPAKPEYVDLPVEVPVNSVVKVQPRPVVPPSRQACKSLLLRAMAEAQKSTALVKPRDETAVKKLRNAAAGKPSAIIDVEQLPTKLYTSSYRNKSNIVIQVARGESPLGDDDDDADAMADSEADTSEVEYVMENIEYQEIADDSEEEQQLHEEYAEEEDDMIADDDDDEAVATDEMTDVGAASPVHEQSTQFVVTLDDIKNNKYAMRTSKHLQRQHTTIATTTNGVAAAAALADGDAAVETVVLDREESSQSPHTGERTTSSASQKVNKLIIQNDTDDEEELRKEVERSKSKTKSTGGTVVIGDGAMGEQRVEANNSKSSATKKESSAADQEPDTKEERRKRRRLSPITFDLQAGRGQSPSTKRKRSSDRGARSSSRQRSTEADGIEGSGKRPDGSRKYDNVPALAVTIAGGQHHSHHARTERSKERCKYYPACGKGDSCEFTHPISTCKQFPLCTFGDQCIYFHPRCMFDLTCTKPNCNYSHSLVTTSKAPPLSSHVVPVSNYKSITNTPLPALCRFHPNCSNTLCTFYHPKACHFGRNCVNKIECSFWHGDGHTTGGMSGGGGGGSGSGSGGGKDKLKWFASSTVY